jgi:hypothetical protein
MSLDNILCSARQSAAVLELIFDNPNRPIDDDTLRNALYSIQDNMERILKAVDESFDSDRRMCKKLFELGIFDEVMKHVTT